MKSMYTFLFSRLRSAHGIPTYMRAASNPGGPGNDWVLERFAPWLYPEDEVSYDGIRVKPEQQLWYRFDELKGEETAFAEKVPDSIARVFFPAKYTDTPQLDEAYRLKLDRLDAVDRRRLKFGDWMARAAAGAYFRRAWLQVVDAQPADVMLRVRYWDRAATAGAGDFTAGVRMSMTYSGVVYIEHVVREQLGPGGVESTIATTAETDPPGTMLVLEHDPGSAGKFEANYYMKAFARFGIIMVPPQGDKITRARPVSSQAEAGNIKLVRGTTWNEPYLRELEAFPEGHDDQVDGTSGGYRFLLDEAELRRSTGAGIKLLGG